MTDLQIADVQSPARFEFFNELMDVPAFKALAPTQRPQEALTAHAVDSMVRTLNRLSGGPVTGAPIDAVVTTGDAIDNAQWNETEMFLALLEGGRVRPRSGGPIYQGVQSQVWPGTAFWRPDGGRDMWRERYGFPTHPGLLDRALEEFEAAGLRYPWLACYGNHEALAQGMGGITEALGRLLVGDRKPVALPAQLLRERSFDPVAHFISSPDHFATGLHRPLTADPARRPITRCEFIDAHFRDGGQPSGHGFTAANRRDGTAYYSYDLPHVRLISLDTNYVAGGAQGSVNGEQMRWLEEQLVDVHSQYDAADGRVVQTGSDDRLVVVFSHHGSDTLGSGRATDPEGGHGTVSLLRLLHRFQNVVLWLNGHTHTNTIRPQRHPHRTSAGFWEVTTCAIVDWPCQARLVEIVDNGDETLSVVCTMLDHDSSPGSTAGSSAQLAALHRELAGNVPWAGFDSPNRGAVSDRNVELRLRSPFTLNGRASGQRARP